MISHTQVTLFFLLIAAGAAHAHALNGAELHNHYPAEYPGDTHAIHAHRARQDAHAIPPLPQISQGMPVEAPVPLKETPKGGAQSPYPGAPSLPNIPNMSAYPPGGQKVPTDSPEVKAWMAEIAASGVKIPDIPQNKPLPNDAPAGTTMCTLNKEASDNGGPTGTCWWSCSSCSRDSDIIACPNKMDWGLSLDDGPSPYTPKVLDYLAQKNLKATFYVIGANVVDHPQTLQATYLAGHEIGIHTWTHPQLTTLTNDEIVAEIGWTRKIIKDVLGVTPLTVRLPYGDGDDRVRAICKAMGLTPVIWTEGYDTDDWAINSGRKSDGLMEDYKKMLDSFSSLNTGVVSLQHDFYQATVDLAVGYFWPAALEHNPQPKFQPVAQCKFGSIAASFAETSGKGGNAAPVAAGSASTSSSVTSHTSSSSAQPSTTGSAPAAAHGLAGSASTTHTSTGTAKPSNSPAAKPASNGAVGLAHVSGLLILAAVALSMELGA